MNAGYRILPPVYDRWQKTYGKDFSTLILPRLLSSIRRHRIQGSTMVDVACGTGTLALMMARRGWEVSGIDASEGMLAEARAKFTDAGLPVTLLRQDMSSCLLPRPVALATSLFDSVNHCMTPEEMLSAFRSIHAALLPGGWFVFDTNNESCFKNLWTKTDTIVHDDFVLTLENSYSRIERKAMSTVTLAARDGDGTATQSETVSERFYPVAEVRRMLDESALTVRECEDFNFTSNPDAGKFKTWWVTEKRGG